MKKILLAPALFLAFTGTAYARVNVAIGVPAPVVVAPAPVYAAPVYAAPPVYGYYAEPPDYPYYRYNNRFYSHDRYWHRWHEEHREHWDH